MKIIMLKPNLIYIGSLILVNAQYPYREGSANPALLPIEGGRILLSCHAVEALSDIMNRLNGWEQITAVSGWRSMKEQEEIYAGSLKENGRAFTEKFVALPGHSEHQTGLAIDLALKQDQIDFICPEFPYTGICETFRRMAVSYGFVERYPAGKEHITGISHEPWHFRYVGVPHAGIMTDNGFVLEEYISFLKKYPHGKSFYACETYGTKWAVSYLEADKTADTRLETEDNIPYSVSGNNIDGFIITGRRN